MSWPQAPMLSNLFQNLQARSACENFEINLQSGLIFIKIFQICGVELGGGLG